MRIRLIAIAAAITLLSASARAQPKTQPKGLDSADRAARQPRLIEAIVAVVGKQPVFLSQQRHAVGPALRQIGRQRLSPQKRRALRRRVLRQTVERLIERQLVQVEAKRRGLTVTQAEVNGAIDRVAKQNKLSRPELMVEVQKQGLTPDYYRGEIHAQILEAKLLQMELTTAPGSQGGAARTRQLELLRNKLIARLRRHSYVEVRVPW